MSMQLMYTKVTNETLEKIKKDAELINAIFMEGEAPLSDWDYDKDTFEMDYRWFIEVAAAHADGVEIFEQTGWAAKAIGHLIEEENSKFGRLIDFEFCYGPAFYFTAEEVKKIAAGLAIELGDMQEDSSPDDFEDDVPAFFRFAAEEGKAVVGGVN